MIKITAPTFTDAELFEEGQEIPARVLEQGIDFMQDMRERSLSDNLTISVRNGFNADDATDVYENVEFKVSARFTKDGITWLAGEGFAVNLDSMIASLKDAHNRVNSPN